MKITIFPKVNPFPTQDQKIVEAKFAIIGKTTEINGLEDLPNYLTKYAWSPAIFNGPRKASNFNEIYFLAYDIDDGLSILEAESILKYLRWSYIIAKTISHQKEKNGITCDRYRIILPLEYPINNINDYKYNWDRFAKYFNVDCSCRDISRFYFGCYDNIVCKLRDIIILKSPVLGKKIKKTAMSTKITGKLSTRTELFLKSGGKVSSWHTEFLFATRDIKAQGYTYDQAEQILSKITGHLDEVHDLAQIKYIYDDNSVEFEYRSI